MGDTLQYRRVMKIEYTLGSGEIKLNMEGSNDNYYSNVDEVQINPKNVDLNNFTLEKNAVTMQFSESTICNIKSGKYYNSMICGAKFEGKNKGLLVEKLEDLASRLDLFKDEAVEKKKEDI